jgi:hypothetical protein
MSEDLVAENTGEKAAGSSGRVAFFQGARK